MVRNIRLKGILISALMTVIIINSVFIMGVTPVKGNEEWSFRNVNLQGMGFVTGIVIHPEEENLVYVRTDVAGAYRWNDVSGEWINITDSLYVRGIEAIALDANNADLVYIVARPGDDSSTAVMYKSQNRGQTWEHMSGFPDIFASPNGDYRWYGKKLVVDPNDDGNTLYFASRRDGLWKSSNAGQTWSQISTAQLPTGSDESNLFWGQAFVAVDSTTGNDTTPSQTVYVGVQGEGIYKSINAGSTWTKIDNPPPIDPNTILNFFDDCTSLGRTFSVTDVGPQTWTGLTTLQGWQAQQVIYKTPTTGDLTGFEIDALHIGTSLRFTISVSPDNINYSTVTPQIAYTGLHNGWMEMYKYTLNSLPVGTQYLKIDWEEPSNEDDWRTHLADVKLQHYAGIQTDPNSLRPVSGEVSSDGNLYVALSNQGTEWVDGTDGRIYKYDPEETGMEDITPEDREGQGFTGINVLGDKIIAIQWKHGQFKGIHYSEDAGENWTQKPFTDLTQPQWYPSYTAWTYVAQIMFDPHQTNKVWMTNGFGVYVADDITEEVPAWVAEMKQLEELVTAAIRVPPVEDGADAFFITMDKIGFRISDKDELPTSNINANQFGIGTGMDYAVSNPSVMAYVGSGQNTTSVYAKRSTDNGLNWTNMTVPSNFTNGNIAISATDPDRMVWAPLNYYWGMSGSPNPQPAYSTDGGQSWATNSGIPVERNDATEMYAQSEFLASDRVNGNLFYYYTVKDEDTNGKLYRSTDGGENFSLINSSLPAYYKAHIRTVPGKEGHLYFNVKKSGEDVLYKSTDSGATFSEVTDFSSVGAIGFGKINSYGPILYVSGVRNDVEGVYRSEDYGSNWELIASLANGVPVHLIRNIEGDLRDENIFYMATGGRGLIYGVRSTSSSPEPAINLLENSGFESDFTGWTNDWGNTVIDSTEANTGTKSARTGTWSGGIRQDNIAVTGGVDYVLDVYGKLSESEISHSTGITFYDSSNNQLLSDSVSFTSTDLFEKQTLEITAPANAVKAMVWVWKDSTFGYLNVDDFSLTEVSEPTPPPAPPANLMENSGFESDFTGWTNDWGNTSVDSSHANSGAKSSRTGTWSGGIRQDNIAVTGGVDYVLEVYGKLSASGIMHSTGITFYDAANNELLIDSVSFTSTESFEKQTLEITAPINAVKAMVWVWKDTTSGYLYVDDFSLTEAP